MKDLEGPMVFLRFVIRERNEMYIFMQLMITGILICDRRQRLKGVLIKEIYGVYYVYLCFVAKRGKLLNKNQGL